MCYVLKSFNVCYLFKPLQLRRNYYSQLLCVLNKFNMFSLWKLYLLLCIRSVLTDVILNVDKATEVYWKKLKILNTALEHEFKFDGRLIFYDKSSKYTNEINNFIHQISTKDYGFVSIFTKKLSIKLVSVYRKNLISFIFLKSLCIQENLNIMNTTALLLNENHQSKIVFVLPDSPIVERDIQEFMKWCWKEYMINAILVSWQQSTISNNYSELLLRNSEKLHWNFNIFTYLPLENSFFVNLRYEMNPRNLFKSPIKNLNKYKIRIALFDNKPNFLIHKNKNGELILLGPDGRMFNTFMERLNGTYDLIQSLKIQDFNLSTYKLQEYLTSINAVDLLSHLHPLVLILQQWEMLQPFEFIPYGFLVPSAKPYPQYMNLILPFDSYVWIVIVATLFAASLTYSLIRWFVEAELDIGYAWLESFKVLLYMGTEKCLQKMCYLELGFIVLLLLMGFILTNIYLALLTSFLTSPIYEKELNTQNDIAEANIPIMGLDVDMEQLFNWDKTNKKLHETIKKNTATKSIFLRDAMNTSEAYYASYQRFNYLLQPENRAFRFADEIILDVLYAYVIPMNSPYKDRMNEILFRTYDAGLVVKFKELSFQDCLETGHVERIQSQPEPDAVVLTVQHLQMAFYILVIGNLFACVCFICELIIYRNLN